MDKKSSVGLRKGEYGGKYNVINQPGLIKIRTSALFSKTVFMDLTARFIAVSKRNVH